MSRSAVTWALASGRCTLRTTEAPSSRDAGVNLRDRRRRQRLLVDDREHLGQRSSELGLDGARDNGPR